MRTWIKLASLALVAGLTGGVRAQDRPRSDDKPRNDNPPPARPTDDRTRDQDRTRDRDRGRDQDRARTDRQDDGRSDDKTLTDDQFTDHAYTGGQNEVLLGRLAMQRARNEAVRKFAQRMIEDHAKTNQDFILIVSEQRIAVPDKPLKEQRKDLDRLHDPALQDFDKEYMDHMVKDHQEDVKLFERAAKELKNEKLKAFAEKALPTLKEHLKLAQEVQAKLGSAGRGETGTERTETGTHRTETQPGTRTETQPGARTRGEEGGRTLTDNQFVMAAAAAGKAEVAVGKIGEEKAKNPDVKKFADRVVTDHTKANEALIQAAKDAGITVSEKPDEQNEHVKPLRLRL